MEMIKGIAGHGYYDELVVPIIENSAREYELTDALAAAVSIFPSICSPVKSAEAQYLCFNFCFKLSIGGVSVHCDTTISRTVTQLASRVVLCDTP